VSAALQHTPGEWGGVVLAGNAPVNGCLPDTAVCEQFDEALSTPYGGNDPHDSSGVVKSVQIRWAGFEFRPDEELNSFTLLGVGDSTVVDFVQTHAGPDDGIEMFGGTVNLKHIVMTNAGDDSLDWQLGWTGKAQFGLVVLGNDQGDHGIEADNNEFDFESQPRSKPIIANMTLTGGPTSNNGAMLRRGTGGKLYNMIFTDFGLSCINIDSDSTFTNAGTPENLSGELIMEHSWVNCAVNFDDDPADPWLISDWFFAQPGNVADDPQLDGYLPAEGSPLLNGGTAVPEGFFEPADYVGAFRDRNDDWTRGWTIGLDHLRN
jgi:hypothetical protein